MTNAKRLLMTAVLFTLPVFGSPALAQEAAVASADEAVARLERAAGSLRVTRATPDGLARFVSAGQGQGIAVAGATGEAKARTFLARYGDAFGLLPDQELRLVRPAETDEIGMEHVRLQQAYQGVPVAGAEFVVHLRGGRVVSASGRALPDLGRIDTVARIGAEQAAESARALIVKHHGAGDVTLSAPRLEILDVPLLGGPKRPGGLAWFVEARRFDVREFVWVDAHQGRMLLHFSQVPHAKKRQIFDANSGATLPGVSRRKEGAAPTGDPDEDAAYEFSGDTYDYFFTEHGRDSFDGKGGLIKSTVDFCPDVAHCPYENAFWNGTQMVYGDGYAVADDVDAHELTHAVTERTAGLFYYMQSGSLNESFSDIFGETVDQTNGAGNDAAGVRWKLGEDVPGFPGGIRDMKVPGTFGDPGKVDDVNFKCFEDPDNPNFDNGSVHQNSGVPNHAYQLMVDGGTFNSTTVTALGFTKAGKIQYRALTKYLTSGSNFLDDYEALIQSCNDLIGTAGIVVADCNEVKDALDAVEMSETLVRCPAAPITPATCPLGQGPVPVFSDDLEKRVAANWKTTVQDVGNQWTAVNGGSGTPKIYYDLYASSGKLHFLGAAVGQTAGSSVEMAKSITVPPNAFFQFNHSYGFESNAGTTFFDGGVIEFSTNNGASWLDAGGMISAGANYGGMIGSGSNPLVGRSAFVRESWGYTTTQLNLSALAGQKVRFRFRLGTDDGVDDYGWFVDDVQLYTCTAGGTVALSAASFNGSEASGKATITATRSGGTAPFTVDYFTANGTATAGQDYTAKAGTLTFAAGVTTQTFDIPILNDTESDEDDAVFTVTLHHVSPSAALGAPTTANVFIADNDVAGTIQFTAPTFKWSESNNAILKLKRTGGVASGATVHYTTSDGTAQQPGDYTQSSGFVTFAAGQTTAQILVPLQIDTLDEEDETFTVTLDSAGGGAVLGPQATATETITDNDEGGIVQFKLVTFKVNEGVGNAVITVTRSGGAASGVTVNYATVAGGTATAGLDYANASGTLTFGVGDTTKTFTVVIANDPTAGEGNETVNLQLSVPTGGSTLGPRATATITIADND